MQIRLNAEHVSESMKAYFIGSINVLDQIIHSFNDKTFLVIDIRAAFPGSYKSISQKPLCHYPTNLALNRYSTEYFPQQNAR
jgi:hypothetical protein